MGGVGGGGGFGGARLRWVCSEPTTLQASDILVGHKERRHGTINRNFVGDYIGYQENPSLRALVGKKEVRRGR